MDLGKGTSFFGVATGKKRSMGRQWDEQAVFKIYIQICLQARVVTGFRLTVGRAELVLGSVLSFKSDCNYSQERCAGFSSRAFVLIDVSVRAQLWFDDNYITLPRILAVKRERTEGIYG